MYLGDKAHALAGGASLEFRPGNANAFDPSGVALFFPDQRVEIASCTSSDITSPEPVLSGGIGDFPSHEKTLACFFPTASRFAPFGVRVNQKPSY